MLVLSYSTRLDERSVVFNRSVVLGWSYGADVLDGWIC